MKRILFLSVSILLTSLIFAQAPQNFQYQAVVRDASGNALVNQSVNFRISILSGSVTGTPEYIETHTGLTNAFGVVILPVGSGIPTLGTLSGINWGTNSYFIKVEADPAGGTSYIDMGTTQLLSVPYALYAKNSGNIGDTVWSKSGNDIFNNNSGNVGIGISSPAYMLHVNNPSGASSAKIGNSYTNFDNRLFFGDGNYVYIGEETLDDRLSVKAGTLAINLTSGGGFGAAGQVLKSNGTTVSWQNESSTSYLAGTGLSLTGNTFNASTTTALWNANQLQGRSISSTAPTSGQVLGWNGTNWLPTTVTASPGGLNKTVQFNNSGVFAGDTAMIWDNTNKRLGVGITNPNGRMVVRGSATAPATEPLFEVKNALGQTVFVVYPDSVHIYVKDDGAKSNQGGFAVSGRNNAKAVTNDFLVVDPNKTNIYTGDPTLGFGVSDLTSGSSTNYMHLTPNNYLIGQEAGKSITSGSFNSFLGYQTGFSNLMGNSNVCIGYMSGYSGFTTGFRNNVFVGNYAGYSNNSYSNIFIGNMTGKANTAGYENVYIGDSCAYNAIAGQYNTFIGTKTAFNLSTGSLNTFYGNSTGFSNSTGSYNTFIGLSAGEDNTTGNFNTYLGTSAGVANNGNNNVFIGYHAGWNLLNASNTLAISTGSSVPLIGGDFSTQMVGINRVPTTYTLEVGGTIWANGATISSGASVWSDARYKKDILTLENALLNLCQLRGVTYDWKNETFPEKNFPSGKQIGVIAQEVEKIYPELVNTDADGYKTVSYEKFTPILIEAVKQLNEKLVKLETENALLKVENTELSNKINEIDVLKAEIQKINLLLGVEAKR